MKVAGGETEDGIVIGNTFDKYGSGNPIVRKIMRGFESSLKELVAKAAPTSIHEVGCGEGHWTLQWAAQGIPTKGSDFSMKVLDMARQTAAQRGVDASIFSQKSIYDLDPEQDGADLIVCCEVLEHLEEPAKAMAVLNRLAGRHIIVSVPREPLWGMLNMVRLKYVTQLGNTPGHLQRWTKTGFLKLLGQHMEIVEVKSPLPWTMALCKPLAKP